MDPEESSPGHLVLRELSGLREHFRDVVAGYQSRIEAEIGEIGLAVEDLLAAKKVPQERMRDLRDMLTLLRNLQLKPEKGRRKDLKKIDALVGDLTLVVEAWRE